MYQYMLVVARGKINAQALGNAHRRRLTLRVLPYHDSPLRDFRVAHFLCQHLQPRPGTQSSPGHRTSFKLSVSLGVEESHAVFSKIYKVSGTLSVRDQTVSRPITVYCISVTCHADTELNSANEGETCSGRRSEQILTCPDLQFLEQPRGSGAVSGFEVLVPGPDPRHPAS
jgi:hypothetical protein